MRRYLNHTLFISLIFIILLSFDVYAGEWKNDKGYWEYAENGSNVTNQWRTIDGVDYLFDGSGKLLGDNGYSVECPNGLLPNLWKKTKEQAQIYNKNWQQGVDLINQTRAQNGVQPLVIDYDLCMAATYRCVEAIANQNWDHYIDGVLRIDQVIGPVTNNRYRRAKGENMGGFCATGHYVNYDGSPAVIELSKGLKESPGHFKVMIQPNFTRCGVGLTIYTGPDGTVNTEYIQVFE